MLVRPWYKRSIVMTISVCLSVCLSVREQPSINPELRVQSLPKLALHVIGHRPANVTVCYLLPAVYG